MRSDLPTRLQIMVLNLAISSDGLIAVDVVLTAIATVAVFLRIRTRLIKKVKIRADDILSIIPLARDSPVFHPFY